MKHFVIYSFALLLPLASEAGLSAYRAPNQSFAKAKALASSANFFTFQAQVPSQSEQSPDQLTPVPYTDPESLSKPIEQLDIDSIPDAGSFSDLENQFHLIRDTRFLVTSDPAFPRRLTWLYPDDGCYARAELASDHIVETNFIAPKKIFAFGSLAAKTDNSPYGLVRWWYHVAVIYRVGPQAYVLDPAIDAKKPMTLEDWSSAINNDSEKVTYSVCSKDTFDPDADCLNPNPVGDRYADSEQRRFLNPEWSRLEQMNRIPEKELGDFPPWLN